MRGSSEIVSGYLGEAHHEEIVERAVRDIAAKRYARKTSNHARIPRNTSPRRLLYVVTG